MIARIRLYLLRRRVAALYRLAEQLREDARQTFENAMELERVERAYRLSQLTN